MGRRWERHGPHSSTRPRHTSPDTPIGAGLLAFAGIAAVSFAWAAFDTARHPVLRVIVTWCAAGTLAGIGMVLTTALGPGDFDVDVVLSDVLGTGPFLAGLIIVPALFATLLVGVPLAATTRGDLAAR